MGAMRLFFLEDTAVANRNFEHRNFDQELGSLRVGTSLLIPDAVR
jgi:hypothetical protein